jgi:hypothetical protein
MTRKLGCRLPAAAATAPMAGPAGRLAQEPASCVELPVLATRQVLRTRRRLTALRRDLWREARRMRQQWRYRVRRGRIEFEPEVNELHARYRQGLLAYALSSSWRSVLAAPVIYSLIVPFVLFDLWVTAYQWISFPLLGIERVRRRAYFRLDRHRLSYLNVLEKANCTYCTYANGVVAYVREVAARTEQYWCPIKHAWPVPAPHPHYHEFLDYGDGGAYRRDLGSLRRRLQPRRPDGG